MYILEIESLSKVIMYMFVIFVMAQGSGYQEEL